MEVRTTGSFAVCLALKINDICTLYYSELCGACGLLKSFRSRTALSMHMPVLILFQEKLHRRIERVKVEILNPPRKGKKLLVLDIDYTIFDLGSSAENPQELARPYLHDFMAACYENFDLMIWSATSMKWVEVKMRVRSSKRNYLVGFVDPSRMVHLFSFIRDFSCFPYLFDDCCKH